MGFWIVLAYGAWLLTPTPHTVAVESVPTGATIKHRGEVLESTPTEVTVLWFPGRGLIRPLNTLWVRAPGYRPARVGIGRGTSWRIAVDKTLVLFPTSLRPLQFGHVQKLAGVQPRNTHYLQMMRKHGRSGTWTPEDAERLK